MLPVYYIKGANEIKSNNNPLPMSVQREWERRKPRNRVPLLGHPRCRLSFNYSSVCQQDMQIPTTRGRHMDKKILQWHCNDHCNSIFKTMFHHSTSGLSRKRVGLNVPVSHLDMSDMGRRPGWHLAGGGTECRGEKQEGKKIRGITTFAQLVFYRSSACHCLC